MSASVRSAMVVAVVMFFGGMASCKYAPTFPSCQIRCDTNPCPAGLMCTNGLCGAGTVCGASGGQGGGAVGGVGPGGTAGGTASGGPGGAPSTTWVSAALGLEGGFVNALVIDPAHTATVYAATNGGVWKSTDPSQTAWRPSSAGLPRSAILSLTIDPAHTNILYAGTAAAGIYKTTDAGTTWQPVNVGPANMASTGFTSLAVDPYQASYVFAGLTGPAVYVSTNSGQSWSDISDGIMHYGTPTLGFAFGPSGQVFAATYGRGLYVLPNYTGTNWASLGGAYYLTAVVYAGTTLYAATDTQGLSYLAVDVLKAVPGAPASIWSLAAVGDRLYLGGGTNGITTWDTAGKWPDSATPPSFTAVAGTGNQRIHTLAVDPREPALAYAGTETGVYRKDSTLLELSPSVAGLRANPVMAIAIDAQASSKVYAGLRDAGLYRSLDGGGAWSSLSGSGIPAGNSIPALAVDPQDPQSIWVRAEVFGYSSTNVFKSINGGASFNAETISCEVGTLAISPSMAGTIYAGCRSSAAGDLGAYVETRGRSWMPAATGLPSPFVVDALIVDRMDPSNVWAGLASAGVYHTSDGGALWTSASSGLGSLRVAALAANQAAPSGTLFAATADQGVWRRSINDLATPWASASTGLPAAALQGAAIAFAVPNTIYLGTQSAGVFRSTDGGSTWSAYSTGLGSLAITKVEVDPTNPNVVYAGTWDGGLYKTR